MLLLIRMRSVCIQLNTNVIKGLVKRAQLLWHVHNFCETAQLLGNVHSISETCTYRILENTGWGWWNTLYPYMYMCVCVYIYMIIHVCLNKFVCMYSYMAIFRLGKLMIHIVQPYFRQIEIGVAGMSETNSLKGSHRNYVCFSQVLPVEEPRLPSQPTAMDSSVSRYFSCNTHQITCVRPRATWLGRLSAAISTHPVCWQEIRDEVKE